MPRHRGDAGYTAPSPPTGATLLLFNTWSGRKEPFECPDGRVRLYVCGVTPYDTTHLGHAFTYVTFDLLIRVARHRGLATTYVQNVTDVDDDLLRRARRDDVSWRELAQGNVAIFRADLETLNVLPPDQYPWASQEVPTMLDMIGRLLDQGFAYLAGANVYFRVGRFPTYGALSALPRARMLEISDERGANTQDPNKEDPLDFVLWQASAPDEPSWETPWGPGRPGWHIECSAMSYRYLGPRLDVHGGGGDLIFPHHESEIAQSESFTGVSPFSRFWMHVSMLRYQGEKMSKSLGNMLFVRELRREYSGDAIRLSLLSHHYRETFDYDERELQAFQELANGLAGTAREEGCSGDGSSAQAELERGIAALEDDLDAPAAVASLQRLADLPPSGERARATRELGGLLGLRLTNA
ncbi:MAG: cysteine--tRNA ligase [Chloroflexi bacterium]|nr:cysteine--tRNA ligase [Chloroflexota bacterium]